MQASEPQLFALATAWGDKLRGRASLQVPTHAGRLHPRDEQWLTLEVQKLARRSVRLETYATTREFLAVVRETVDVWHAIACCPGFTGRENPIFWRRVVSHTYRRTHQRQHGCSDEFTFCATSTQDAFPRLRLYFEDRLAYETTSERARDEAAHVDLVCRAFFGLDGDPITAPSTEYLDAMTQLQPYISRARYDRVIPVALDLPSWDTEHLFPIVAQLLRELRAAPIGSRAARFRIDELSLDDMRLLFHDNAFESYQHWLTLPDVRISHWWWKVQSMNLDATVPPSAVRVATGLEGTVLARLQTLLVNRHTLTDQQFGGLCAALPHARTLRHVRFSELSRRHDWAWLAFALFHRDASTSSWQELSVDMCHLDADDLAVIRSVRDRGLVSLRGIVGDLSPLASYPGHAQVLVKANTTIQFDASSSTTMTIEHATWFDAIGHRQSNQLGVVVPAYGLGFVPCDAVTQQQVVVASTATSVTHFRAMVMTSSTDVLRDWVCLIGATTLELVEITDHTALPATAIEIILSSCPSLTSLNVTQDGSVWTRHVPRSVRSWPQLQTLNVCSPSPEHAMALLSVLASGKHGPLPGLRQLRLELMPCNDTASSGVEEARLRHVARAAGELVRRVPTLSHVNLHGITPARGRGEIQTLTYDAYRATVLSTLVLSETDLSVASRDARVALLSVWYRQRETLASLSPDLVRIVFAFAGRAPRNAWIEL